MTFAEANGTEIKQGGLSADASFSLVTVPELKSNKQCPLCRLLSHLVHLGISGRETAPDLSQLEYLLAPVCIDNFQAVSLYRDWRMLAKCATVLSFKLSIPQDQKSRLGLSNTIDTGLGFQLLSPNSVNPGRPLHNGFKTATMDNNLRLLHTWMNTCVESHYDTCRGAKREGFQFKYGITAIDVVKRTLVCHTDSKNIKYAALSYVWETTLSQNNIVEERPNGNGRICLPPGVAKTIGGTLIIFQRLEIPYLWVDAYCIHQNVQLVKPQRFVRWATSTVMLRLR